MARCFTQLNLNDRCKLRSLILKNTSNRKIAKLLGVDRSTIYRELQRNDKDYLIYNPAHAQQLANNRRQRPLKLLRDNASYPIITR